MWFQKYELSSLTMLTITIPLISSIFLFSIIFFMLPSSLLISLLTKTYILEWVFFRSPSSPIDLTLIIDPFGLIFSLTVLFISANVILFATSYIAEDIFLKRFIYLVLLFVISMNFLIFIPNLIALLIGWDGLGLTSFLLVIYYQNPKSLAAGIITALTNRIGDVLILISIAWALNASHWNIIFFWHSPYSSILAITLIVAAITKSAQVPFSAWLPAAIAAPTPVSALVHSSTLVTAGIFLLFRFYPFLSRSPLFHKALLILASLTTLIAGLRAITECDIKKIIALSTLRQLGVIIISLALGAPVLAFFHLITHALFKALLFVCAGTLIHLHHHSQDLRFIGNLRAQSPSITSALLVANIALCGAPFMAGFYSKDIILEFSLFYPVNFFFLIIFLFATGLTARYTARFLLSVIWSPSCSLPLHPVNDSDMFCTLPTFLLSIGAIAGGRALNWLIITPSNEFFLPPHLKFLTLAVTIIGFTSSWLIASNISNSKAWLSSAILINYASCYIWFLAPLSSQSTLKAPFSSAHLFSKSLDHGWEELLGGQGILSTTSSSAKSIQNIQSPIITSHLTIGFFILPLILIYL